MSNNPQTYHFVLPEVGRPDQVSLPERWYPGIKDLWPGASSSRRADAILGIKGIVIHATAGVSSAGAVSVMNNPVRSRRASFHWLIPDEDEDEHEDIVWACVPEARAAWHVRNSISHPEINDGKNETNHWSLGIELVNAMRNNDTFSTWQVGICAKIVRYCWAKYPNLKHVFSHAIMDPSRRSDPGHLFPWNEFRDLVVNGNDPRLAHLEPHPLEGIIPAVNLPPMTARGLCP